MSNWQHEVDFVVVGSGAAGMAAAVTANKLGLECLVIEKSSYYGGTTALSGGVAWVPNNHHMSKVNISDNACDAKTYLEQVVSDDVDRARIDSYIQHAPEMLKFLEANSLVEYLPSKNYPDYYANLAGGKVGARSLDPKPYSIRKLGSELFTQMRPYKSKKANQTFSITVAEAHQIFQFRWYSQWVIFRRLGRFYLDIASRIKGMPDNRLTLGRALVARLRHSLAKSGVPVWLETPAQQLIKENQRVIGIQVKQGTKTMAIKARKGVLLASGGFAHNESMRQQYHPAPTNTRWSASSETDTGDGLNLAAQVGAKLGQMHHVWWTPTLHLPSGMAEALIAGKSLPSSIIVNKAGQRFCNEAEPYEDLVKHQYQAHQQGESIPAYFIFDGRYRKEYPLGNILGPGKFTPDAAYKRLFDSGFITKAASLEALADKLGIDRQGLLATAAKFKQFSESGVDEDFARGEALIDRFYSDRRCKPNPCLGGIEQAPFYGVKLWPGDLGTKGGIVTNQHACALDANNEVIAGLYAAGNASSSVMGDSYPGAGATIGPAMTFAYLAAKHAAEHFN